MIFSKRGLQHIIKKSKPVLGIKTRQRRIHNHLSSDTKENEDRLGHTSILSSSSLEEYLSAVTYEKSTYTSIILY